MKSFLSQEITDIFVFQEFLEVFLNFTSPIKLDIYGMAGIK